MQTQVDGSRAGAGRRRSGCPDLRESPKRAILRQATNGIVKRLEVHVAQRGADARNAGAVQSCGEPAKLPGRPILEFVYVQEYLAAVGVQLDVQALAAQLRGAADELEPGALLAQQRVPVAVGVEAKAFAEGLLDKPPLAAVGH